MTEITQVSFKQNLLGFGALKNAEIDLKKQEAGRAIKTLVLEELSNLNPFPQIKAGHEDYSTLMWDGKEIMIDGILLLTARQSGTSPRLGHYIVLRRDGLYRFGIFFSDIPSTPNLDYFKNRGEGEEGKLADDSDYLLYHREIAQAIEREKRDRR